MRAVGGFPVADLPAGFSIPWSSALRTMCIKGSASSSTMVRSISVSSPLISNSAGLPIFRERSLTCRATRWNNCPMGTSRIAMEVFWISLVIRASCARLRRSRGLFSNVRSGSWRTMDCAITISPAMSTR